MTGADSLPKAGDRWWERRADALGVAALAALTAIVAWNRFSVDPWLARVDVLTFFLPW